MGRVVAGFLIAPLAVAFLFALATLAPDQVFFIALFAYPLTLLCAVPLFFAFKRFGWLECRQTVTAGLVIAALFAWFFLRGANPYHVEIYGVSEACMYLATGGGIALVFWFIAIFRNERFPDVSPAFPGEWVAIVVLLMAVSLYTGYASKTVPVNGQILALTQSLVAKPTAVVRLDPGGIIHARLMCYVSFAPGDKVSLYHRPARPFFPEHYWIGDKISDPKKFDADAYLADATKCLDESLNEK